MYPTWKTLYIWLLGGAVVFFLILGFLRVAHR
jgi:hypothetical protein